MKNILWVLLLVGFVGCSNKTTQDSNTVSPTIKEIPVDEKLITADISVVPDPSNEFTMDIKTGQKVLNFEIKNNSPSNGAVKINLTYKNEITINNIGTTCGVSGYTRLNSNSSCMLSILVNSEVMNAGVLTYNFNIQEPTNGIISTYQNFISVLDPLGNGNVSFPGSSGTCKVNYHLESRSCKFNVKACVTLPPFALTGTQTWTGAGYGGCVITQCELGYDLANNTCSISTNPYELAAVNGNAATANHTVSFKSSHKNNYTFVATGTGGNYIERVMSDLNNDGVSDGNLSGLEGLVGTGNVSCGKNASSGFVECFLSAGRSITLASKPVSYDNVGDGSGLSSLPISLVDKLWSHGESQITGTAYTNVLMKDKTIYSFYGQGNSSIQKAIKVKYSLSADSTIDGDLIADNNTDNISYTSSNSASSTTIYSCVKSSGKIMCWYRQGNDVNQMALPVQIDTNSDGTGDSDLDASQVVKIIPTTGYTGLALMQSGQVYSWLTTGRGVQYARPVVLYNNTTTPLVLNNVSEFATSFQRNCALTSDKIYCWLAQGLGANGATIVKADLNNDNVVDGDLDASLVEKSIPSHSNAYTYLLLKNGRILSFIGDGQSGTQSARYILNAITGLPQESMSFPFSSGKTYTCGIYNKKNIYCFYGQSQVGGGSPVLYDSDGDFIGDTPFDIDDNNPLQRRIIINKTANQGSVDVKDLATNNVLGTCASTLATCTILVPDESNISIVSTALDGYNFVNYTDPKCLGTNATCNLTAVNSNLTITPIFSAINYTVTVNVLPANLATEATLVIRRASVACSGACLATYNKGTQLTVIATPSKYVNNATFEVLGTGVTNTNVATANQLTLNVGTSDVVVNITLTDKELTVPTFSFNGTLSGSLITIPNNPLTVTTSNVTMAREILISESANCSTGSYVAYASPINYTYSVQLGTNPVSFMFRNNTQLSACYPYTLKMTNVSRACNPQPNNSVALTGTQVSTDGGTTWGLCSGFTCNTAYHTSGNTCVSNTQGCSITNAYGTQSWNSTTSTWNSCVFSSCYDGYYQENATTCSAKLCSMSMSYYELINMGINLDYSNGISPTGTYPNCVLSQCNTGYIMAGNQKTCSDITAPVISLILSSDVTNSTTSSPSMTITNVETGGGLSYNYITIKNSSDVLLGTINDNTSSLSKIYNFTGLSLSINNTYTISAYSADIYGNISATVTKTFTYEAPKKLAYFGLSTSGSPFTNPTANKGIFIRDSSGTQTAMNLTSISIPSSQLNPIFGYKNNLFLAYENSGSNGLHGNLYMTDGTSSNSYLLLSSSSYRFTGGFVFNNSLYITGNSNGTKVNPWKIDIAARTATMVSESFLTGGVLYKGNWYNKTQKEGVASQFPDYIPGCELDYHNGTTITRLKNIYAGNHPSNGYNNCSFPHDFVVYNGLLYFVAYNGGSSKLWKTDGTAAGTVSVKVLETRTDSGDLLFGFLSYPIVYGDELYFISIDTTNMYKSGAIWKISGSSAPVYITNGGVNSSQPSTSILIIEGICNGKIFTQAGYGWHGTTSGWATRKMTAIDTSTNTSVVADALEALQTYADNLICYKNRMYYAMPDGAYSTTYVFRSTDGSLNNGSVFRYLGNRGQTGMFIPSIYNNMLYFTSVDAQGQTAQYFNYFDGTTVTKITTVVLTWDNWWKTNFIEY